MNISIRKLILVNLLMVVAIMLFINIIGNYWLNKQNIEKYLDNLLVVAAEEYRAFISANNDPKTLAKIESTFKKIPNTIVQQINKKIISPIPSIIISQMPIQVWSKNNVLLLNSHQEPLNLLGEQEGLSDKKIHNTRWRVYTLTIDNGNKVAVAQSYDTRNILLNQITLDDFYMLLATLLLAGVLIWIIIGNEFKSLERIAKQIADRAPTNLEPVNIQQIPSEIIPVVNETNKLIERLKVAIEKEKHFSANAAHELRTPLAILKTHAQVALKTSDPIERTHALQNLIQGVNRSAHIVQQLLTLNRLVPEAAALMDHEDVKIVKLASETIAQLAPSAIEKEIEIELDCANEDFVVSGNITALSILIRNLIDNAIRYIPEGGQITVSVTEDKHNIIFRVADNGPGIPGELRGRVFERFFRVLGNKSAGSGLGLAIVNQIASLHHATVNLRNNLAQQSGLIVEIFFPKKKPSKSE